MRRKKLARRGENGAESPERRLSLVPRGRLNNFSSPPSPPQGHEGERRQKGKVTLVECRYEENWPELRRKLFSMKFVRPQPRSRFCRLFAPISHFGKDWWKKDCTSPQEKASLTAMIPIRNDERRKLGWRKMYYSYGSRRLMGGDPLRG